MNTRSTLVLSSLLALPVAGVAMVSESQALTLRLENKTDEGSIVSVSAAADSFVLKTGGKDVTIQVSKDTKYYLNGVESARDKVLVAGHNAKVTHAEGLASKVDVTVKKPTP